MMMGKYHFDFNMTGATNAEVKGMFTDFYNIWFLKYRDQDLDEAGLHAAYDEGVLLLEKYPDRDFAAALLLGLYKVLEGRVQ